MKTYCCEKCGKTDLFIDDRGSQKALMCGDCGAWLKWIGKKELPLIERFIESNKDSKVKESVNIYHDIPLTLDELENIIVILRMVMCFNDVQNKDKLQRLCDKLYEYAMKIKQNI